jgi:hypothetical protein
MKRSLFRKQLTVLLIIVLIASALGAGSLASPALAAGNGESAAGFDVTKAGANGGDGADDTAALQSALDKNGSVYIPDGTYYINVDRPLQLRSNQTLTLSAGAVLAALPTSSGNYCVLDISGASNVTVTGGRIVGERASHRGTSGEWGMGILIENGASNISVTNIMISDCWGDGVYLGGGSPVTGIRLDQVTCDNNRRQGLSITCATDVTITDCVFKNTHGTAPAAGIDIEPNKGDTTSGITITNTKCFGNEGSGLDLAGFAEPVTSITVSGCDLSGNHGAGLGISNASDISISGTVSSGNMTGVDIPRDAHNVRFTGVTITGNYQRGVSLVTTDQAKGVENIAFTSTTFSNNSQDSANDKDGIRIDRFDASGYIKGVTFTGCKFLDDQSSKTQRYGLTVGFTNGMSGIVVTDSCTFSGNISGNWLGGTALKFA